MISRSFLGIAILASFLALDSAPLMADGTATYSGGETYYQPNQSSPAPAKTRTADVRGDGMRLCAKDAFKLCFEFVKIIDKRERETKVIDCLKEKSNDADCKNFLALHENEAG